MSQLTYLLMGATLPIVDHLHISDAGVFGQQTQTPLVDISYLQGGLRSAHPLAKRVELPTGSVSPIVPIRGMLNSLRETPEIYYADLGTGHPFDPVTDTDSPLPVTVYRQSTPTTSSTQFPPLKGCYYASVENAMEFSARFIEKLVQDKDSPDQTIIIAECVPGGTSTAALLLSAMNGQPEYTPSSSRDESVKLRKHQLVTEALSKYKQAVEEGQHVSLLALCDAFQLSLFFLLASLPDYLRQNPHLKAKNISLGGGSQMTAVVQLLRHQMTHWEWHALAKHLLVVTTPWCAKQMGLSLQKNSSTLTEAPKSIYPVKVAIPSFDFTRSRLDSLQMYQQGYTVEGCGLGAVMHYTKDVIGVSTDTVLFSIEYLMYKEGFSGTKNLFPQITYTNTAP